MKYALLIILQSIIFALIDVFAKIAFKTVSVAPFMTARFVIATLGSFILYGKTIINDLKTTNIKHYLLPSICMGSAINFSNIALNVIPATTYSFIRSMSSIIGPVLLCIFFKRKYKFYDFIIQISLVVGLYLLCAKGGLTGSFKGELLAVFVSTLIAISIVFGSDAVKYVHSQTLSATQLLAGLIISIPCGLISHNYGLHDFSLLLDKQIIEILLFNAIIGTLFGYLLQNIALEHISSKTVGIVQDAYPVFTAIAAFIFLNEKLSVLGIIGSAIITICVVAQSLIKE